MSLFTTPLQFGYFFSLTLWICLLVRGFQHRRLSDKLLGWVMFLLAMEMQDYTFGFAGINVLWNELNGFPRGVSLIFGPVVYFYFRSQVNREFRFSREHAWHLVPYGVNFLLFFVIFLMGPSTVERVQESPFFTGYDYVRFFVTLGSYVYYFRKCLLIYRDYRAWSLNQFSNTELIGFAWFRNFVYAMIFWIGFRAIMNVFDTFYQWDFYQDWWWNLALVVVAFYIGLIGYAQKQPANIAFEAAGDDPQPPTEPTPLNPSKAQSDEAAPEDQLERQQLAQQVTDLMQRDRLFLQPELNLRELARHLKTNPTLLSATINQEFQLNFNDYINTLRIEEFVLAFQADTNRNYTLLSLALDSGFNSKATFNRAFKKLKGQAPKDYLGQLEANNVA